MHHTGTKESKKEISKKKIKKVTENFLQGDQLDQLEIKFNDSILWTTSVNADSSSLKEVYIPSLW